MRPRVKLAFLADGCDGRARSLLNRRRMDLEQPCGVGGWNHTKGIEWTDAKKTDAQDSSNHGMDCRLLGGNHCLDSGGSRTSDTDS
jgi:hypothetical protein